ncbi:hypothetical protein [Winogradskyella sp. UBA3174]|uniref:hypothetical protein n=1 Tax=Winogradskyella sp. UBA3174 TaxID=1947785 RepID=UPI0025CC353B|nr:hypothetical protein [Winogradskyella sp. UBA3174]|tara:strand:+ start:14322 stop:15185 length:864 start_codon:yes stop_codon:yes gene_type:complete
MKKRILLFALLSISVFSYSQQTYTIKGETLELITEIEGQLDLLWNTIDGEYRYFVRTEDNTITELKNTKGADKNYNEEYKVLLEGFTNGQSTYKLKLTRYDLRNYFDLYNTSVDSSYVSLQPEPRIGLRLGFSGGITNNPFVGNPDNVKTPLIGAELEIFESRGLPRSSGFLEARHAFNNEDFQYSTTEFSLGYRYRFINTSSFSIYGQVKLATLNFTDVTFTDANNMEVDLNETAFDVPLIFGIGSDIKVSENSFITIIYGELFAGLLDNQGNFSTDIAIGYKFNL